MYALVYYPDGIYYVCSVKNILNRHADKATVKYKDGKKYDARIIAFNDSEEILSNVMESLHHNRPYVVLTPLSVTSYESHTDDSNADPDFDPKSYTEHTDENHNCTNIDDNLATEFYATGNTSFQGYESYIDHSNTDPDLDPKSYTKCADENDNCTNKGDNLTTELYAAGSTSFQGYENHIDDIDADPDFDPKSYTESTDENDNCTNKGDDLATESYVAESTSFQGYESHIDDSGADPDFDPKSYTESTDENDNCTNKGDDLATESYAAESTSFQGYESHIDDSDADPDFDPKSYTECTQKKKWCQNRRNQELSKMYDMTRTSSSSSDGGSSSILSDGQSSKCSSVIETPTPYGCLNIQAVAPQGKSQKKYFCKFCHKMITKLARHLENVHKHENEVKMFSLLPKGCPERKKIIHLLRSAGSFMYNTNSMYNKGDLLVSRRPRANLDRKPEHFECCPKCKGSFSKLTLRHHAAKCLKQSDRTERSVVIMGRRVRGTVHPAASSVVKEKIFPYLREDMIVKCIRYDELVIRYCNQLCMKYRSSHHHKMIRSQLRLTGRFLLRLKEIDDSVKSMSDAFEPKRFDSVVQVIAYLGDYDEELCLMKKPNIPLHMGTLLKKMAKFYISECIKKSDEVSQKIGNDFLTLITTDFNAEITQTALESRLDMQRKKKIELPSDNDVHIFLLYLLNNVKRCYDNLLNEFSYTIWKELASFCLLWIICFNRRRVGEVERMKIVDFNLHHGIDKFADKDIYHSLSTEGKKATSYFRRVSLRGKLGRTVHILLCKLVFRGLELILKCRNLADVAEANPFVFGLPGLRNHKFIEACSLLRFHSAKCGALRPDLLRGTHLRKHIATRSVLLNLTDTQISDLANYMGHNEKIHRSHYRLPIVAREITEISTLLQKAQGGELDFNNSLDKELERNSGSEYDKSRPANESYSDLVESFEDVSMNYTSPVNRSREEIHRYLPSEKKMPWTSTEIQAVREVFKKNFVEISVPKMSECCRLRLKNPSLRNRSPQAIRCFIATQLKRNTCSIDLATPNSSKCRKRWSELEKHLLTTKFKTYYDTACIPSLPACKRLIEENPILKDRTPEIVKAKVNNDLRKMKSNIKY